MHSHCADINAQLRKELRECFPLPERKPPPSFLRPPTLGAVQALRWADRTIRASGRRAAVREKGVPLRREQLPALTVEALRGLARALVPIVRKAVQEDRDEKLRECGRRAEAADSARVQRDLFREVMGLIGGGRRKKGGLRPLPSLRRADGSLAVSAAERAEVWEDHFGELEAGVRCTTGELGALCQARHAAKTGDVVVTPEDIVSLPEFHAALLAARGGRTHGEDAIPQDALAAAPAATAQALYPLVFKVTSTRREPIQHKGGVLQEIWKGRGLTEDARTYRDILLGDDIGKRVQGALRAKLMAHAVAALRDTQCGGMPGKGSDLCALTVREHLAAARRDGRSASAIFGDLKEAYYRTVREVVTGGECHAEVIHAVARRLRLPGGTASSLVEALDGLSLLRQAGVPEHLAEMVREMHATTWFAVQGGRGVLETRCGTRPGVPMGDFIFLFFLAARMRTLDERLRGLGIWCELDWDGRRTLQGRLAGPLAGKWWAPPASLSSTSPLPTTSCSC